MTQRWKICLSILSLSISLLAYMPCHAQSKHKRIFTEESNDSVPFYNGLAVSVDVAGIIQYAVSDYGQFEGALRVNLHDTYFPILEMGLGKANHSDDVTHINYQSSALYWRLGADYNLMKDKHDDYRIYGGLRYAFSYFNYDLARPGLTDPVWGTDVTFEANDVKCNCHWAEVVAGVDSDGSLGNVWYVPGFGKTGSTRLGLTFDVGINI